ncbi:MAG: Enoyl-CoA hydratase [Myxococcaceae bacterium]|nr:Enoyl-CoA hydratase [Myxococcaceae bacterium]
MTGSQTNPQRPEYRHLQAHKAGGITQLTMARPERKNALGPVLINELLWALDDARDDPEVRVVVLTGAGKAFCAGADLREMSGPAEDSALPAKGDLAQLLLRFPRLHKPVIAKVRGVALGGGLGLVASCHFALAAESAQLGTPEILRGLFPLQIMAVLQHLMPRRQLLEMMLLGQTVSAKVAESWGLLTRAVPDDELDAQVDALAQALASRSPTATRVGLAAFEHQHGKSLEEALPYLREQLVALLTSADGMEGLAAFVQKRAPVWAEASGPARNPRAAVDGSEPEPEVDG